MRAIQFTILLMISLVGCTSKTDLYQHISLDEFILEDGFSIELIAGEPLLDSPMSMCWDDKGRIWAAEMPGYMRDIEGTEEYAPDGRIVILEDTDGDGKMDKRTVFLDNLVLPRALTLAYNGLLYVETPNLYWVSIDNDTPQNRELVDSNYVQGGNIEHQPNGLLYNIDNWIYNAKSNVRYRRKNGKWLKEATTFRGQWGITNDTEGRLFYNDNSNPLFGDFMLPNTLIQNPYQKVRFGVQQNIGKDRRVFPYQATAVNRGYQEGVLDTVTEKLRHFTSSCSPLIYKGTQFPTEYQNNAFVCGPEVNLVKRYLLKEDEAGRLTSQQAYENKEFLISKDETFRPISLYNAPDGSMYILDLRKGVIQHRAYMTKYLYDKIKDKQLDSITGIGRIYKLTHHQQPTEKVTLPPQTNFKAWLALLESPNSWLRDRSQQWLINHPNRVDIEAIQSYILESKNELAQIHGLWVLEGLDKLNGAFLTQVGDNTQDPIVWSHLLKLSSLVNSSAQVSLLKKAATIQNDKVQLYLANALGRQVQQGEKTLWLELAKQYKTNPLFSEALISGIHGFEKDMIGLLTAPKEGDTLQLFLKDVMQNIVEGKKKAPQIRTEKILDRRNRGMNLYAMHCGSCHGLEGEGLENLAPPLYQSEYIAGDPKKMVLISLHGMKGEVTVQGKTYNFNAPMPGYANNPQFTDEILSDILSYVRNGFGADPSPVSKELVERIRASTQDRAQPYTALEVMGDK